MTPSLAIPALLILILIVLLVGFFVVWVQLIEIRDALTAQCQDVKRLADEITDEMDKIP